MTLYWDHTGPLVKYFDGTLYIEDLNPEVKTKWRMSKSEMVWFGLRCLVSVLRH